MLKLAKKWKYTRGEATALKSQLQSYFFTNPPFHPGSDDVREHWNRILCTQSHKLREKALLIFNLCTSCSWSGEFVLSDGGGEDETQESNVYRNLDNAYSGERSISSEVGSGK